ncbi:MAG: S41 family peptidase [Planctomycetota bacterium]|nr:S41 family peptidase [Planctomycetota bacterium]
MRSRAAAADFPESQFDRRADLLPDPKVRSVSLARPVWRGVMTSVAACLVLTSGLAAAQPAASERVAANRPGVAAVEGGAAAGRAGERSAADWTQEVWASAVGDTDLFPVLFSAPQSLASIEGGLHVQESIARLRANIAKREEDRAKRIAEVEKDLDQALEKTDDVSTSKALRSALELELLINDRAKLLEQQRIKTLIERTQAAAKAAETRGDYLWANEFYARLDALLEQFGQYKRDAERLGRRLAMIRLYAPEALWEMRNRRQLAEKAEAIPPYNPTGEGYAKRLDRVSAMMVARAIAASGEAHISTPGIKPLAVRGIDAVRTLATTTALRDTFPSLQDDQKRGRFLAALDRHEDELNRAEADLDVRELNDLLQSLVDASDATVALPEKAIIHEFGNGAMSRLDEFSTIIWPDEVARFERTTQSTFVGVGIRIEFDELYNIRVVTPLEGMPAHRGGVRAGDVIKSVDGTSLYGAGLEQAVELITGPINTTVTLSLEREEEGKKVTRDITIKRSKIEVSSAQGWKRSGPRENDWDWFIDREAKVGYVRLSQFTERTTSELDNAIAAMTAQGMRSLILDLRSNPGGYLDQAIGVARRFVNRGRVVGMMSADGRIEEEHVANGTAVLNTIPVAVLINEGSASASEIVSGAIGYYGKRGRIKAVVVGQRSYGKGSVQVVTSLGGSARLKLTTQYYTLPDGTVIHRKENATTWGVQPDVVVDMLPAQFTETANIRKSADVLPFDADGNRIPGAPEPRDPQEILSSGSDPQLETALVLLQSQTLRSTRGVRPPTTVRSN